MSANKRELKNFSENLHKRPTAFRVNRCTKDFDMLLNSVFAKCGSEVVKNEPRSDKVRNMERNFYFNIFLYNLKNFIKQLFR